MRPVFWRECIRRQSSIPPRRAPNHHKGDGQMQVSRLIWICRAHRDKYSIKPQVRAVAFWGVLGLLQKACSLGFSARRPPRWKAAPSWRQTFAQIKPAKINLSTLWARADNNSNGEIKGRSPHGGRPFLSRDVLRGSHEAQAVADAELAIDGVDMLLDG